jgi:glutamine synthetase
MAKPYPEYSGSGLHTHFSVIDTNGDNVFDSGGPKGTAMMKQAVAGCLNAMHDSTLLFAPHQNSYERLVPGMHAPTAVSWGYENRTSAIRIPAGNPAARRIEHRVAGGDVNPYLMLAAILGAALDGIEREMEPASPIVGNAYAVEGLPQIAETWEAAIDAIEQSTVVPRFLHPELIKNLVSTKRQELHYLGELSDAEKVELYLDTV